MPLVQSEFALSRDPRLTGQLADQATAALPAWLWAADGSHMLWANAVGAAIFGANTVADCAARRFEPKHPAATEIVRLAATLPSSGQARLERLRGFGASFGRTLTCLCSRVTLADGSAGVLVIATEPAGPALTLRERVSRLLTDQSQTLAVFSPDGSFLAGTAAAQQRLVGAPTLAALGVVEIAAQALAAGNASGVAERRAVSVQRLGTDASVVLAVKFGEPQRESEARPTETLAATTARPQIEATPPQIEPEPPKLELALPKSERPAREPAAQEPVKPAAMPSVLAEAAVPAPSVESAALPVARPPAAQGAPHSPAHSEPFAERRHPLRFVWQMDTDGRFVVGSDEFTELMGPQTTSAFGRLWSEVAAELKLDPDQQVARAVATRETWSGITVSWPVDDGGERLPVEMSGLPIFDRERQFRGYRGFGVCREIVRINQLAQARRERPIGFMVRPEPASEIDETAAAKVLAAAASDTRAAAAPAPPPAAKVETETEVAPPEPAVPSEPPSVPPVAANVVPFRQGAAEPKTPSLSPVERKAFRELAQELTARLRGGRDASVAENPVAEQRGDEEAKPVEAASAALVEPAAERVEPAAAKEAEPAAAASPAGTSEATAARVADVRAEAGRAEPLQPPPQAAPSFDGGLLDRIPVGVLIYQQHALLYANRHFLDLTGYQDLDALTAAGWLRTLVAEAGALSLGGRPQTLSLTTSSAERREVEARLFAVPWGAASALALILTDAETAEQRQASALSLKAAEKEIRELAAKLESAKAEAAQQLRTSAQSLSAAETRIRELSTKLETTNTDAVAQREASAQALTAAEDKIREITAQLQAAKKSEEELRTATREAERAAAAKSDFVSKVSHEIRTPLNTITGFTEVMMAERFGPIGNDRYREYLKDVHAAGLHIVALLNDLLDLSKIESGQLPLSFANVNLNELTQQCVGIMQPQASRARIIIRTSLTPNLPQVVADERSLRQIVLNLLSNSIRFTGPGGQVIVSTAFADSGETLLRVRDTGAGMSEKDVEAVLEPFRQTATAGSWGSGGTGLGLPLTKALAEANRAHFSIKSAPNAGTLVEVAFPPALAAAE